MHGENRMRMKKTFAENKNMFYLSFILLLILFIVVVGVIIWPSVFYDNWIWKYYWGPVVADASGGTAVYNGVEAHEGYTMVSEITYGLLLIVALYLIYKLLKKLEIVVDWRFALSLMPYILFGPAGRVLEDAGYFKPPLVYWFISPFIYIQIAFYALFFLLIGWYLERKTRLPWVSVNKVLFLSGLMFFIPSLYVIISLVGGENGVVTGVRFDVFLVVAILVFLVLACVYLFTLYFFKGNEKLVVYRNPLNLAMLTGHLVDGFTSYISIKDPFSMGLCYLEKHPASNFLLDTWGPLFPIVKFLLVVFIIYVFDILYKEELKNYLTLVNLLKIGILILGFSPGLRDLLRVTLGV